MKCWRSIAVGVAATVVSLTIAAAIALHVLGDSERLKTYARDKAREAGLRDLAIGDIALHLLPRPSVFASDVSISDAFSDKDPWQLHADRVVVSIALWPLLRGEVSPRSARIEGDIVHQGHNLKVVAALDDISHYGQPDAASDGRVDFDWGKTHATISGRIPLQPQLRGTAVTARLESQGLNDMLGFFGIERPRATASARAHLELSRTGALTEITDVDATLGKHRVTGSARISGSGPQPIVEVSLRSDRIDWAQLLLETGDAPVAPLPPTELFYDRPIAWPLLVALQGMHGTIDARLGSLSLRNGVELQHVKADMTFEGDDLRISRFTANLLGGSVTGTMQFAGRKKQVHTRIQGTGLLLERWFKERGREIPFTGGAMAINASINATGNSMRDLAKSMTGPVSIQMGPGVYASQKAGDAEAIMVAFSKKDSTGVIAFECAGAGLSFMQGRAAGNAIVGARSDVSRLLTSGYISLRDETVDLRGRVQPKPGMGVGLSAIAGNIRIAGSIRAMKVTLDPAATPEVAARAGAAVLTLGLSLAGSAIANAAHQDNDPCTTASQKQRADR